MAKEELKLVGAIASIAAASIAIAASLSGSDEAIRGLAAFSICLTLGVVGLRVVAWSLPRGPVWQMGAVLGGSCVRCLAAAAAAVLVALTVPACKSLAFAVWMVGAYLITLGIETFLAFGMLKHVAPRVT